MDSLRWNEALAFDMALSLEGSGEPIKEILVKHSLTKAELTSISHDPVFQKKVLEFRNEIQEKGLTFRLKARAQAEELLRVSWNLVNSNAVSPAVRADLIKSMVKWGGLEPSQLQGDTSLGGGVKIVINLGDSTVQPKVIEATVTQRVTEEAEEPPNPVLAAIYEAENSVEGLPDDTEGRVKVPDIDELNLDEALDALVGITSDDAD